MKSILVIVFALYSITAESSQSSINLIKDNPNSLYQKGADSLRSENKITKEEAIIIAKKAKYYYEHHVFSPKVELDSLKKLWVIESMVRTGVSREKCRKKCLSCVKVETYTIKINYNTGRILRRKKRTRYIAFFD